MKFQHRRPRPEDLRPAPLTTAEIMSEAEHQLESDRVNTTPSASDPLSRASFLTAEAPREAAVRFWTGLNLHQTPGEVASAVLTATAHGVYEARIDGMPASDSVLDPGVDVVRVEASLPRFDVTDLLARGSSTARIELLLGNGWYRGDLGFAGAKANFGDEIAIAAAIEVTYRDGTGQHLATSPEWHAETSEIIRNSLYNGETIDARLRGRAESLRCESRDRPIVARTASRRHPCAGRRPAPRQHLGVAVRTPAAGLRSESRRLAAIRCPRRRGTTIAIRPPRCSRTASSANRLLRGAEATDVFIRRAGMTPSSPPSPSTASATRRSTAGPASSTGDTRGGGCALRPAAHRRFACSDPMLNRWSEHRLGTAAATSSTSPQTAPSATSGSAGPATLPRSRRSSFFQFDTADFLDNWLRDLLEETRNSGDGIVPIVVPDVLKYAHFAGGFSLPPLTATECGETPRSGFRKRCGTPMAISAGSRTTSPRWCCTSNHREGCLTRRSLGGRAPVRRLARSRRTADDPGAGKADPHVVATACLYRSASFASEAATLLGRHEDAERWAHVAERTAAHSAGTTSRRTDPLGLRHGLRPRDRIRHPGRDG